MALSVLAAGGGCIDLIHNDVLDPRALAEARAVGPRGRLDVAIALGCPADDDTGELSACERCRVTAALGAYRRGEVGAVIFSGGAAHNRFIEADVMGRAAVAGGLPEAAVIPEPRALTTWMNLRFAKRLMEERNMRTALVITTAAHVPRARRFVEWYGIPARYLACDLDPPEAAVSDGK